MSENKKPTAKVKFTRERIVKKVNGKWMVLEQNKWSTLTDARVRNILEQYFRA